MIDWLIAKYQLPYIINNNKSWVVCSDIILKFKGSSSGVGPYKKQIVFRFSHYNNAIIELLFIIL